MGDRYDCHACGVDCMDMPSRILVATGLAVLMWVSGCDKSPDSSDVPAQAFTSRVNLIGHTAGSLKGQFAYPSAFTQRSTPFYVDGVQLMSQPDGRFFVRSIPAGDHELRAYVTGYEPVLRGVRIAGSQLSDAQVLALQPARGKLIGRIVTDDGRSAAGATVHLQPYGLIGTADRDGIFQFMGIGGGEHRLAVQCPGCESEERLVRLQSNESRNIGVLTVTRRAETAAQPAQAQHVEASN
jgi:hypothetical protein